MMDFGWLLSNRMSQVNTFGSCSVYIKAKLEEYVQMLREATAAVDCSLFGGREDDARGVIQAAFYLWVHLLYNVRP